jgi:hypothetical protein
VGGYEHVARISDPNRKIIRISPLPNQKLELRFKASAEEIADHPSLEVVRNCRIERRSVWDTTTYHSPSGGVPSPHRLMPRIHATVVRPDWADVTSRVVNSTGWNAVVEEVKILDFGIAWLTVRGSRKRGPIAPAADQLCSNPLLRLPQTIRRCFYKVSERSYVLCHHPKTGIRSIRSDQGIHLAEVQLPEGAPERGPKNEIAGLAMGLVAWQRLRSRGSNNPRLPHSISNAKMDYVAPFPQGASDRRLLRDCPQMKASEHPP